MIDRKLCLSDAPQIKQHYELYYRQIGFRANSLTTANRENTFALLHLAGDSHHFVINREQVSTLDE